MEKTVRLLLERAFALLVCGAVAAAEDPLADLRAEVEAIVAKATLTSSIRHKGDGGPRYVTSTLKLIGDSAAYGFLYKSFLPPNEARNRSELNDWASGLGMNQPSDKGWYHNGFVEVALSDSQASASISDSCGEAKLVKESGKVVAADFVWTLQTGHVRLRFFIMADRPELFLLVTAQPKTVEAQLSATFRCYPGGYAAPFDRRVHTAARELANAGPGVAEMTVDPAEERWMLLADHYAGVTPRPMGPCSIAVEPDGVESAGVRIQGNYSVVPTYAFVKGRTSALFVLREFPPTPWQSAMADVAATTQEALQVGRRALAMAALEG